MARLPDVLDKISSGSFGTVYKVVDTATRKFAIKIIDCEHRNKLIDVYAFEINVMGNKKHCNIVSFIEAFEIESAIGVNGTKVGIVFELMHSNLSDFMSCTYPEGLDFQLLRHFMKQILSALLFLQEKKIVHRDIKPENLLVNGSFDTIKLCDFGLARFKPTF